MAKGPKISIKWKLFIVVAVLISTAVVIIVSHTTTIFREDKGNFVKELSAKLASSTVKNVLNRITTLQDKLVIFISSRESLAHTGAKVEDQVQVLFSRYQEFVSIGFLTTDDNGRTRVEWVLRNPQGPSMKWPADYERSFLSSINTKNAAANGRGFWRAQSPDGNWLAILGFSVQVLDVHQNKNGKGDQTKTAWIVGVMPSGAFDDLLNDFSTGLNHVIIVDDSGIAIADSDPVNRWKAIKNHPLVAEMMGNTRPAATGDYTDVDGRAIIGSFEMIPKMNLAAIVTTPRDKAFEAADQMSRDVFFIGGLILLIALAAAVLLSNYVTGPLQKLAGIAAKIGAGDFKVPVDVNANDEIGELAQSFRKMEAGLVERDETIAHTQMALVQSEKMSAFGQLSAGIAHEVKNPLAGILGHAQLAMGKVQSDDIKKHLEVIEKETRRCKTIVENLMKFARAEKAQLTATDLAQVAQDTINLVDHQLSIAGCKIFKDFKPCPMVEANSNMLQQVLLNLMVNASHAMENCPVKNVTVRVLQVGKKAQIQVEDTGSGIPPEIQKKIFEPFFTTKPAGKGTGLGLSVSIGIVKDHKGDIYIKSEQGKGTTFFIDIPIPENAVMPAKALENTHGGTAVAVSASAPAQSPSPAPVQAPAPAAASASASPSEKTATAAPTSEKISEKTAVTATVPSFISEKTVKTNLEDSKVVNIKDAKTMKTDLPKGLPKVADIKKTTDPSNAPASYTSVAPNSPAASAPTSKMPQDTISAARAQELKPQAPIPHATFQGPKTLGGKNPLDDATAAQFPKPPDEEGVTLPAASATSISVTRGAAENDKDETQAAESPISTTTSPSISTNPSLSKTMTDTGFKVKITRPKIKV